MTYIFILLSIMTGSFHILLFISALLIIHELGHFITAYLLKVPVDKIYIYPFGGISKFYLPLNSSILKEIVILINGPLFQELCCIILCTIFPSYKELIILYNNTMLTFNLLPIYPLDGGKLINLVFQLFNTYKRSIKITIFISYIFIMLLILVNINNIKLNIILLILFLIYKVFSEEKKINYNYENFLLERYLNKYQFKKRKIIKKRSDFYRNKKHLIAENGHYLTENQYLDRFYKKK